MDKKSELTKLFCTMSNCSKCTNLISCKGKDYSLVNIFKDKNFYKNIPSIWTDWYTRLNSKIMLIGQDWGPYTDMKKFNKLYMDMTTKENWKKLIDQEKSMTKKMLTNYLIKSAEQNSISIGSDFLDYIFITNAIMCARKGSNYRGNNINLKLSSSNCSKFLQKQIEIIKPKIILTLGYYPLYSLAKIYKFNICPTLAENINLYGEFKVYSFLIVPLYHPVAQIKKEEQLKQYSKIWKYINFPLTN